MRPEVCDTATARCVRRREVHDGERCTTARDERRPEVRRRRQLCNCEKCGNGERFGDGARFSNRERCYFGKRFHLDSCNPLLLLRMRTAGYR
ncbi:hypothetical protein LWI29_005462 [Acer saccharum]|uniref:Uncharacterized protein n=1 Tax=Acer saccharum TaxID=4024 RepID=A0AA39VFR8_ACESA|nr:hypothetical protein LWI29_005462 [Acer saccharum]